MATEIQVPNGVLICDNKKDLLENLKVVMKQDLVLLRIREGVYEVIKDRTGEVYKK